MNTDDAHTARHPIGVVADRTRLSQDILRVWERRYGAVEPRRDAGGQRVYSDADVERLRLLGMATRSGRSIGQVARLETSALADLVREDDRARARADGADRGDTSADDFVSPAIEYVKALDALALDIVLRRAAVVIGMPAFLDTVATPLLHRIGDEWHAGSISPAQEHLATAIVQRVIASATQSLASRPGAPHLVVATPAGERHEIGAILAAAAAAMAGWRVTYLGGDLPAADIADAAIRTNADAVGLSVVYLTDRDALLAELGALRARLPAGVPLLVGGGAAPLLAGDLLRHRIRLVRDLPELRIALRELEMAEPARG